MRGKAGFPRSAGAAAGPGEVFAHDVHALNEDYERGEGEWRFRIGYGGRMPVEQVFTNYRPDPGA